MDYLTTKLWFYYISEIPVARINQYFVWRAALSLETAHQL